MPVEEEIRRGTMRAAYRRSLIHLNQCPCCSKGFGPQYGQFGNTPIESICDCDGRRSERSRACVVNEAAIAKHIESFEGDE